MSEARSAGRSTTDAASPPDTAPPPDTATPTHAGSPTDGRPAARPIGRPARISRDAIAAAAREIGLADLSLRRVAEHLDVSVATLYHHIDGKDDLLRLAADQEARGIAIPVADGQAWPRWLAEWGRYTFESFADRPALFDQFLRGGIGAEVIAENTERALAHLVELGFDVTEAADAYELVSAFANGSAVTALRNGHADARSTDLPAVLRDRPTDELTNLRELSDQRDGQPFGSPSNFESLLRVLIIGIGARRGEPPADVVAALDR